MQKEEGSEGADSDLPVLYSSIYDSIPQFTPRRGRTSELKIRNTPIKQPLYSEEDVKRLMDLVIKGKKGIKYNPRLTGKEGAESYITKRGLEGWNVVEGDMDFDPDTPDNVVLLDKNKIPRFIDGYSISKRRPDFLFQRPEYTGRINEWKGRVKEGQMTEEAFKVSQSDLKQYYKTHSTQQSRDAEAIEEWKDRHNKEKKERIVHKMYLETYPKEQRSTEKEAAFIAKYKDVKESPSVLLRKLIAYKVKLLEDNGGIKFINKFRLLTDVFNTLVTFYKAEKKMKPEDRLTSLQYYQIYEAIRDADISTYYAKFISWPVRQASQAK
jgi:hypothetical protein